MIEWLAQQPSFARRIIALILLLIMVSAAWLILVRPLVNLYRNSITTNDQLATRIQRDKNLIAAAPAIKANLEGLRSEASDSAMFFQRENDADAVAALQTQVQNFIVQDGGEIQSIEPMAVTSEAGLDVISIELDFSLPIQDFPTLLQQLEMSAPFKFIPDAAIQSSGATDIDAGTGISGQQLSINWTIDAYRHVDRLP